MEKICHKPNFEGVFADEHLNRLAQQLSALLFNSHSSSIKGTTSNEAEQKGFYRFLENERTTEEQLIGEITKRCSSHVAERHILCIQDTSSIGLNNHRNRLQENSGAGW